MIRDFFLLAFTNIRQRKLRSWLTMIGIFIGVAAVIALISLGQGLQAAISEQFSIIGTDKIMVSPKSAAFAPPGAFTSSKVTKDDLKVLRRVHGVTDVAGVLFRAVRIEFNDHTALQFATGWPEQREAIALMQEFNNYKLTAGRMLEGSDSHKVVVGSQYADKKLFGKEIRVGNKISVNGQEFKVIGILKSVGDPSTDNGIIIPEQELREIIQLPDEYNLLVARVAPASDIDAVSKDILRTFRKERNLKEGKEDIEVQTPQQLLESFSTILNIVQAVLIGIAAISLLVGGIGIMNTMYTSVVERTREIGVLKALGAKKKHILSLFLIESGLLGLMGGSIGIILGISLSKGVELLAKSMFGSPLLRAEITLPLIAFALLFSFTVGVFSGLFPAKTAAELQPMEALRYE